MDVEPRHTRTRAGQVVTHTHQRLIDLAIDSLQEDDYSGLPDLETDNNDQESVNVTPQFDVQDDGMIEFMHNINIMTFHNEIIRTNKQTSKPVRLYPCTTSCVVRLSRLYHNRSLGLYQIMALQNHSICSIMYEVNDIWMQHGVDPRVNSCQRIIWLRRVGMFLDYNFVKGF